MRLPMGEAIPLRAEYSGRCKCGRRFSGGSAVKWCPDTRKIIECDGCRAIKRLAPAPMQAKSGSLKLPGNFITDADDEFAARDPFWNLDS